MSNTTWTLTPTTSFTPPAQTSLADPEVIVVGAGISGLTTALALAEQGVDVLVLEAESGIGAGTTSGTSAHLTAFPDETFRMLEDRFDVATTTQFATISMQAVAQIETWVKRYGISCDFERVSGFYYTEDEDKREEVTREARASARAGLEVVEDVENPLPFEVVKIFEVKNQAKFHPLDYIHGLARAATGLGARISCGRRVTQVESDDAGTVVTLGEGESAKKIRAKHLVLATHTPMGRHLVHASLPPYRSYMAAVTLRDPVPTGLFWDAQDPYHYTRDYITPQGQHLLLIGGADHKTAMPQSRTTPKSSLTTSMNTTTSTRSSTNGRPSGTSPQMGCPWSVPPLARPTSSSSPGSLATA